MDTSTPVGTWYLLANAFRLEMLIAPSGPSFTGWIANEGGPHEPLSDFSWDPASRWLEFRRNGPGFFQWYRLSLTYGVMGGSLTCRAGRDRRTPLSPIMLPAGARTGSTATASRAPGT